MVVIGSVLVLLALLPFLGWPLLKRYYFAPKPVSATLFDRTKAAVEKDPKLKPDWDKAMEDGVLTWPEAKEILEKAGEKVEPEE
jgi:hypothetical protein